MISPIRLTPVLLFVLVAALPATALAQKRDPFADLIGKPASEIQGDFALNGKPTKLSELKGKVVVAHFWAPWCGNCLASYPYLRDLHADYKGQGLEMLGLTTYYGSHQFDKAAGKVVKASPALTKEQEQGMLKDFAAHHKLEHRLMTVPRDEMEKVWQKYKVNGIPHVVLIDRKGVIRMVLPGLDQDSSGDLRRTMRELLQEKE